MTEKKLSKLEGCKKEHTWHIFDNFYIEVSKMERIVAAYCGECRESRSIQVKLEK